MDVKNITPPATPLTKFPATIVLNSNAYVKDDKPLQKIRSELSNASNTAVTLDLLSKNFSRIRRQSDLYQKTLPNVVSKLSLEECSNLESIIKDSGAVDKNNNLLVDIKKRLVQRKYDDKNAEGVFSKLRANKILYKNLPAELNKIKDSASKISAMRENVDLLTMRSCGEICLNIDESKLSNSSAKKLKKIDDTIRHRDLKTSPERLVELSNNIALLDYRSAESENAKKLLFRDFDAKHPVLLNKYNTKIDVLNLLVQNDEDRGSVVNYTAHLEEASAGIFCMHELKKLFGNDFELIGINRSKDSFCDFYVEFLKNGEKIKIGIDPFSVSENDNFDRVFLHHTNNEKSNGSSFPVIGVACFDLRNERGQHDKIQELLEINKHKNLNLATYSPRKGCKLIEFDTYKAMPK